MQSFFTSESWSPLKCLKKASIYKSLGVGERHVLIGDTCHSLIGLPMSSLIRARSLVSSLTRAGLLVSSFTRAEMLVSLLTRVEILVSSLTRAEV